MNMRKGTLRYMEKQLYEKVNQGIGMTALRFKFPYGDKATGIARGKTIYSACMPHVRDSVRTKKRKSTANRAAPVVPKCMAIATMCSRLYRAAAPNWGPTTPQFALLSRCAQRNPLLCTIGTLGTSYLYRLTALPIPESFPRIDDKISYHKMPLIRGGTSPSAPGVTSVDEKRLRDWVSKAFADVGLLRENYDPLIHGLRHHLEQEMAKDTALDYEEKRKFVARANNTQEKYYSMLILPALCQVHARARAAQQSSALTSPGSPPHRELLTSSPHPPPLQLGTVVTREPRVCGSCTAQATPSPTTERTWRTRPHT